MALTINGKTALVITGDLNAVIDRVELVADVTDASGQAMRRREQWLPDYFNRNQLTGVLRSAIAALAQSLPALRGGEAQLDVVGDESGSVLEVTASCVGHDGQQMVSSGSRAWEPSADERARLEMAYRLAIRQYLGEGLR